MRPVIFVTLCLILGSALAWSQVQVVPNYGAGIARAQAQAQPEESVLLLRAILGELKILNSRGGGAQPVQETLGKRVAKVACLKCHGGERTEADLVLYDKEGKRVQHDVKMLDRIAKRTLNGSMPPPKDVSRPLTSDERAAVVAELVPKE